MAHRIIQTEAEREEFLRLMLGLKLPFTASWVQGRDRTPSQNKLQRLWCNEIAEQLADRTPEEVRGYCKLTMGVPILRAEDEEFCKAYDRVVRPLPYEDKLACMMEPIDFPVTRRMKVRQHVAFLDHMHEYWSAKGIRLTDPDPDLAKYQARYRDKREAA